MNGLEEYLFWRGDLPVFQTGLNHADLLLLSRAAAFPLEGVTPAWNGSVGRSVPLARAWESCAGRRFACPEDAALLRAMATSERFSGVLLSGYESAPDGAPFAAVTLLAGDGSVTAVFGGPGCRQNRWRAALLLGPAALAHAAHWSAAYLEKAAALFGGRVRSTGYGLGGDLAELAAAQCWNKLRARFAEAVSFDASGMLSRSGPEVPAPDPAFAAKCSRYLPQTSVLELFLLFGAEARIARCRDPGRHDAYAWEAGPGGIRCMPGARAQGQFLDRPLRSWLLSGAPDSRARFAAALGELLRETAPAPPWDPACPHRLREALRARDSLDEETRHLLLALAADWDAAARGASLPLWGAPDVP